MRCDIIAEGVVAAAREVSLDVPLVVRLEGTNVQQGKDILATSGLPIILDLEPALDSDRTLWSGSMHTVDGEPVVMLDVTALLKRALAES